MTWRQSRPPAPMRCLSDPSSRRRQIPKLRCDPSPPLNGERVLVKVKFCGMKRPQDAALAAEIGASYVGVIFAEGPRQVSIDQAREILEAAGTSVKHGG